MTDAWRRDACGRTAGDWAADAALFALAVTVGGLALRQQWAWHGTATDLLGLAAGGLACLGLWARRSSPAMALAVIAASAFSPLAIGAGLVAIGTVAARARGRILAAGVGLTAAGGIIFPVLNPADGELIPVRQVLPALAFVVIAFGWGLYLRTRRELVTSLRERARQLEAGRQRDAELARAAERRRIAWEMHDVLAHRLSLLSVHAGALEFSPGAPAADISQAAGVIRESAAAALSDLRQVITVLRDNTGEESSSPQAALDRLPELIEESRAAGMTIRSRLDLEGGQPVPAAAGMTIYRVVQEGLTNARRHAPGAPVSVTVAAAAAVTSGGDPVLSAEIVSGPGTGRPGSPPASGLGLSGLAERLALVGGTLEHGTNAGREFVLRAVIPGPS